MQSEKDKDIQFMEYLLASARRLLSARERALAEATDGAGFSPNEIAVLMGLETVNTASQLAKDLDVSKALISRSVRSLKERGLIDISISKMDKREQNLSLTEEGERLAKRLASIERRFCSTALNGLSDELEIVVKKTLKLILKNAEGGGQ